MKWGLWSTTAASNSATPPDGWPEGQAPSTVNDCAREMMAQIRTAINNIQFIDLGVTPTETTNTTFTLAGNQMQWYPYGTRVQANVGGTLFYGTVISSSFTTNTGVTLRFDAGANMTPLTNSLSAVATGFPGVVNNAIPEPVWRRKNVIINSCFDLWQRTNGASTGYSGGPINAYSADRFAFAMSATAGASVNVSRFERSANASFVPTVAQAGLLITTSWGISVSAAMATINPGTYCYVTQRIEGFTFRQLAQKPITVSFWVNSRQTGTYCVALRNAGLDRSIVLAYSISSVATWEKKTLTFPKSPSAGTWDYSSGVGVEVDFIMACGSTFQGGAGNWTAANIMATAAQANLLVSAGNVLMLTGVQMEEGIQATPLEPVVYSDDLAKAQRYGTAIIGANSFTLIGQVVTNERALFVTSFPTSMRNSSASATFGLPGSFAVAQANGAQVSLSSIIVSVVTPLNILLDVHVAGTPLVVGNAAMLNIGVGTQIFFDAEL